MEPTEKLAQLLEFLVHVIGRAAIPVQEVQKVVGSSHKRIKAFNLCDGSRSPSAVGREAGIHPGNLRRASTDWTRAGIAFWLGERNDARLVHIYPIPDPTTRKRKKTRGE